MGGFVCQDSLSVPPSPFPSHPFTYPFMKSLHKGPELQPRTGRRSASRLFYVILNFFMYRTGAEDLNKTSRPSGDVVSLRPRTRSRNTDSSEQIESFPHHRYISFSHTLPLPSIYSSPLLPIGSEYKLGVGRAILEYHRGNHSSRLLRELEGSTAVLPTHTAFP